jgi:hypothetical protein
MEGGKAELTSTCILGGEICVSKPLEAAKEEEEEEVVGGGEGCRRNSHSGQGAMVGRQKEGKR